MKDGLLQNNPVAIQGLGLCPALAVTGVIFNTFGLVIVTMLVLLLSCLLASLLRNLIDRQLSLAAHVVIITTLVSCSELLIQAYQPQLARDLGPFLPLVTVNCLILGRMTAFARNNGVVSSLADAWHHVFGFALALLIIAFFRELFGQGSLTLWGENLWQEGKSFFFLEKEFLFEKGRMFSPLHTNLGGAPLHLLELPAGALFLLAYLSGLMQLRANKRRKKQLKEAQV